MSTQVQLLPERNIEGPATDRFALLQIWDVITRNRTFIIAGFALALIFAAGFGWLSTPVYESVLSLRIAEKKSGLPVLEALATLSDEGNELSTEMQMLRSRTLAEATVDSLDLQVSASAPLRLAGLTIAPIHRVVPRSRVISFANVPKDAPGGRFRFTQLPTFDFEIKDLIGDSIVKRVRGGEAFDLGGVQLSLAPSALGLKTIFVDIRPFRSAVSSLQSHLSIGRPQRDAQFVTVKFQNEDPELAAGVPNTLAAKFLDLRSQIQKTEARSTVRFLREQIDTLSQQLSATEDAVRAFREGNRVVNLSDEASVQVGELAKLQADRSQKEAERDALTNALRQAQAKSARAGADSASAYRSLIAFPTLLSTNAAQFLQALNEAENQRAVLLQRRTREDRDVQVLTARIRELEQQISNIAQTYLAGLTSQIASIDIGLSRFNQELSKIPSKELQLAKLERQNKVLVEVFTLLQTRLQEAKIAQAVEDSRVSVVDPALVPKNPVKPNKTRSLILGSLFGLILAIGLTVTRESIDPTVHMLEDVAAATGLNSLGVIPHIDAAKDQRLSDKLSPTALRLPERTTRALAGGMALFDPRNPALEAYRTLRTNIRFARPDAASIHVLVFTSPTPGDGKTTTTANLASALAHQGLRVLLVDGDMRRGTLHQVFGLPREPGLSNLLVGAADRENCIRRIKVGELGTLDLMPSGAAPPNPSELIGSERMTAILQALQSEYDSIIFDSPPLNLVTDAAILATKADAVVLVGRAGVTTRGALAYAAELLRKVRAPALGFVLNDFLFRRDSRYSAYGGYGDYYSYGYYRPSEQPSRSGLIQRIFGAKNGDGQLD
jgi:capsular exopolysaccharide synthesis family protein